MKLGTDVLDHWLELRSHLPAGFDIEATARARGAFRRARAVKDADTLLRLALGYGACGRSLRETCAWAAAGEIATLSDPALLERLHVGYDLGAERVDRIELTDGRGAESLKRFTCQPGDILLADRGYARPRDLRPVLAAGGDVIVRTGWNSLRLLRPDGSPLDLFATLRRQAPRAGEVAVRVDEGVAVRVDEGVAVRAGGGLAEGGGLALRLVVWRKSEAEACETRRKLRLNARKHGKTPDQRSLEAAGYILLLTSLPAGEFPPDDVLGLYRLRWQIELAFKRMKSLAGLDQLPAKKPDLARAWIHARLIAVLLAERIAGQVPDSPPSASRKDVRRPARRQPVPLAPRQAGPRLHECRNPRTLPVENALPGR